MKHSVSALVAGLIFGLGLVISEMVNPRRVRGFLDVAGHWDPTLIFVMVGALTVTALGYQLIFKHGKPLFETDFSLPINKLIDSRLIVGAILFGIGWGLSGFCPGPAIVGLSTFNLDIIIFVAAMIIGMKLFEFFDTRRQAR